MAICRFFLQGACRFGTKCNNEHLDIKQLVKSDLEAAINGKQWPLSCFGPFKDKPCIPGFIEDQSFEEIRWICYEARQKNCVDQFVQQFGKEVMEANKKIKTMAQIPPQVIDTICRLYDATSDTGGNTSVTKSNPFDLGINIVNDTTSIFNKSGDALFGGMAPSTSGGIFGGGGSAFNCQNQQSSVFSQQFTNTNSVFGGAASQNSIFGQTLTSRSGTVGLFGQTPQTTGSLFAQASQEQNQTQPSSNVGLFSVPAQHTACDSIFNQSTQKQLLTNGGNVFSQSIKSQQMQIPPSGSLYPSNTQQTASVFGQPNNFLQQTSSTFGQAAQVASNSQLNNLFSRSLGETATGNKNTIAVSSQSLFAQALCQNQNTSANIYSQPDRTMAANSVPMQPTSFLGQATHSLNSQTDFGRQVGENNTTQTPLQTSVVSSSVYSKLSDLTPDEIEAFKATAFTSNKIPNVPPPLEFIN